MGFENGNGLNEGIHLGHLLLDALKQNPDSICQIDAKTDAQETFKSVLTRTTRLARCFNHAGLKVGDVLAYGGPNDLDVHIPYYAGLMCGLPVTGIDPLHKYDELKTMFKITRPKIIIIHSKLYEDTLKALKDIQLDSILVTFDSGPYTMADFIDEHDEPTNEEFKPTSFDGAKTFAWLVSTSGTTGGQKFAAISHARLVQVFGFYKKVFGSIKSNAPKCNMNLSPVQWISGFFNAISSTLFGSVKLQTSAEASVDHVIDMINKYRPSWALFAPTLVARILKSPRHCDLTCFKYVSLTGSKISKKMMTELRRRVGEDKHASVLEMYGQTETIGAVLAADMSVPIGSCGKPSPLHQIKLVDIDTEEEIKEANKPGEMWVKGYRFDEYYNMPKETAECITKDGFYKTGDILYRDEDNYFYFVDRIKLLIKYNNNAVIPTELEDVISELDGVAEVAVTSVPDPECDELPVACVVRSPGSKVTAQEIKDLIADRLSDKKQLRGGVIFMDSLPTTSTGKIARGKLKEVVKTAQRC